MVNTLVVSFPDDDKRYLFNAFALAKVWRARIMEAVNHHQEMTLPRYLPTSWYVDCRFVGRGLPAFKYLSRYLYRGVLPDKDIINIKDDRVTYRYQESATKQWRQKTLPAIQFLWQILQHVLPKGLRKRLINPTYLKISIPGIVFSLFRRRYAYIRKAPILAQYH